MAQAVRRPRLEQAHRVVASLQHLRETAGWMEAPLALAIGLRLLIFVAADGLARLRSRAQFGGALNGWQKKDALWYLSIAQGGYTYSPHAQSSVNFFPLYPLLIRLIQPLVGLIAWRDSYLVSGMLISWVTFAAACVALYRLTADRFGQTPATGVILLLAAYPFSFYYGAPYTESLYLLLAVLAFLAIERRWWWLAGVVALLAGAERPPGLLLGLCVALAYALDWRRTRHPRAATSCRWRSLRWAPARTCSIAGCGLAPHWPTSRHRAPAGMVAIYSRARC